MPHTVLPQVWHRKCVWGGGGAQKTKLFLKTGVRDTGKIEVETREEMGESFKKCLTVLLFIYTPCNEVNLFCFWKMVFQLQHTFCTYTCTCIPRCRCPVCHFKKFVAHTHMHTYSQYIHCWWCAATAKNIDRERH